MSESDSLLLLVNDDLSVTFLIAVILVFVRVIRRDLEIADNDISTCELIFVSHNNTQFSLISAEGTVKRNKYSLVSDLMRSSAFL